MKKLFQTAIFLLSAWAAAQELNYIKTTTYKVETSAPIADPSAAQAAQDITYFDGLGRIIQQRAHKQSGTGKDIVTHIEYDAQGRQNKDYLPYVSQSASLLYDANALADLTSFYSSPTLARTGNPDFESTGNPYSETQFETSPLSRVLRQAAPGLDWKLPASPSDPDHTIRTEYLSNTATDNVRLYKVTAGAFSGGYFPATLAQQGFYPAGALYKSVIRDENWTSGNEHTIQQFRNKQGQLLLEKKFGSSIVNGVLTETWHDTYYAYDPFGNLAFVLPPLSDGSGSAADLDGLCYQYRYDERNRLVEKKEPGKGWQFIIYDNLNRVVAMGPAFSPFADFVEPGHIGWLFTKYDKYGRIAYTGWMKAEVSSSERNSLQAQRNAQTANLSETKIATASDTSINGVAFRYTNQAWPTGNSWHVLNVNYYDDYNFAGAPTAFPDVEGQAVYYNQTNKPKGFATGSWTRVLETSSLAAGELSYTFYDSQGRPIRLYTSNYLGGSIQQDVKLDFSGTTLYTIKSHKRTAGDTPLVLREDFAYSDQGRLLSHTHKINSNPSELLSQNTYDELGQLILKKVGGTDLTGNTPLQKVNYAYTVRGWMKEINKTASLAQAGDPADLFAFKIAYNQPENAQALFNGNLSETYWRTGSDNKLRRHSYQYDGMGRLTGTLYQKPGGIEAPNSYGESQSYDKNGNVRKLERLGEFDDAVTALMIDELDYAYMPNSNRLAKVTDHTNNPHGFWDDSDGSNDTADDYGYDINGNISSDQNKGITKIVYNHLNFPTKITLSTGAVIEYLYNAAGNKIKKTVTDAPRPLKTHEYLDSAIYANGTLEVVSTAEGYAKYTSGSFNYAYNYVDHLGNVRLTYGKDPATQTVKIMEESNYYPMGLKHKNYNMTERTYNKSGAGIILDPVCTTCPVPYKYNFKFNGQELQEELYTNMYDMPFRDYDPAIGRWTGIDPVTHHDKSPYNGHENNPAFWADPSGATVYSYGNNSSGGFGADGEHAGAMFEAIKSALRGKTYSFSIFAQDFIQLINLPEVEVTVYRTNWAGAGYLAQDWVYRKSGFYDYHWKELNNRRWKSFQSTMDYLGTVPVIGEPFDVISGGMSAIDGDWTGVMLSTAALMPVGGQIATAIKIQRHHVIPKAVYKEFKSDLKGILKRDGVQNLLDLPVPYHLGGHKSYNNFVTNALNQIKREGGISPGSIDALQGQLRAMINDGLENFHKTGDNLNTYFKQF